MLLMYLKKKEHQMMNTFITCAHIESMINFHVYNLREKKNL